MTASTPLTPPSVRFLVLGGSPNSTEALFTNCTLPFITKPLAHLGNRSLIIDTAKKIAIVRLFSVQSFSTPWDFQLSNVGSFPVPTMTSADFSAIPTRDCGDLPPVRQISFGWSLLNLHAKYFAFSRLDVSMCGYLIRFGLPHIQFLFVSTNLCSLAYFSAWVTPNHLATY